MDFDLNVEVPYRLSQGAWHGHIIFAQWIIQILKPAVFVELGTHNGDSYFSFCQSVKKNNLPTQCHAVDSWKGEEQAGFYGEEVFLSVKKYNDENYPTFSTLHRCMFDEAVDSFKNGTIDLLHIDGFHTYEAVKHDFETWLPKLSQHAIVLFHDTYEFKEGFGVWQLWKELEIKYPNSNFNFHHSHGLGVLGIGTDYPLSIERLFKSKDNQEEAIRNYFDRISRVLIEPAEKRREALKNFCFKIFIDSGNGFSENEHEVLYVNDFSGSVAFNLEKYRNIIKVRLDVGSRPVMIQVSGLICNKMDGSEFMPEIESGNFNEIIKIPASDENPTSEIIFLFDKIAPCVFLELTGTTFISLRFNYRILGFEELLNINLNEEAKIRISELDNLLVNKSKQLNTIQTQLNEKEKELTLLKNNFKKLEIMNETMHSLLKKGRKNLVRLYKKRIAHWVCKIIRIYFHPLLYYRLYRDKNIIKKSILFDTEYYLSENRDLYISIIDPLEHYLLYGWKEGRNPHPLFDTKFYLDTNTDVKNAGINPLLHFIYYGWKEGRKPNRLFDTKFHLESNPDIKKSGINPLSHSIHFGQIEKQLTYPLKKKFNEFIYSDSDIKYIIGTQVEDKLKPTILVCAHIVGINIYGGERSFLDIVEALTKLEYNLILTIPCDNNEEYIQTLRRFSLKIAVFNYSWWKKNADYDTVAVGAFSKIIKENSINAVHVNTIMIREPLIAAREIRIPSIVHVRELISYDKELSNTIGYSPEYIIENVLLNADYIVANSKLTANIFNKFEKTFIIHNCIDIDMFDIANNINPDQIKIALISSNIPKKGISDFIEIASKMEKTTPHAIFLLIGPKNKYINKLIKRKQNGEFSNVVFHDYMENSLAAINETNIVLNLSHFQESFGRTILEAMAAKRPVIAYNWGALPELIINGENGFLVPFRDINGVVECLKKLCNDTSLIKSMGEKGREIAERKFSKDIYSLSLKSAYQKIFSDNLLNPQSNHQSIISTSISVIIPNYNYERFLEDRILSIINQTVKPLEIIFLDDCSQDNSIEKAKEILSKGSVPFRIVTNNKNVGTYKQWIKGINEAKGDFVWIAEADDSSESEFIENLMQTFEDQSIVLSYCQSKRINEDRHVTSNNNLNHTNDLSQTRWLNNYKEIGIREVVDYLFYRNTIPNVSACIFRKDSLLKSLDGLAEYNYCGDWHLYSNLLRNGNIAYIAQSLNNFRRHNNSITRSNIKNKSYLLEILLLKKMQTEKFPIHIRQLEIMKSYIDKDYRIDGLSKNSECDEFRETENYCKDLAKVRYRFAFVTTNHNSTNGGSEMLWNESVRLLRKLGHDVILIIKKWDPEPSFFCELREMGIAIYFKGDDEFNRLIDFHPDLFIISTGDQDEGTEWFSKCIKSGINYCIINHLTKEIKYWPLRMDKLCAVREGYLNANKTFFTCWNNHRIMQERLNQKISNAEVFFNPFNVDKNIFLPFPSFDNGLQIAMPHRLLMIHKGQDLVLKVLTMEKWRNREITINLYGDGPDKEYLQDFVLTNNLKNINFFPRINDITSIWKKNHAILLSSYMEGMPIVLVEAMLCGRVPIATNVGGHKEIIDDNINGFIAEFPTIENIDNALERAYIRRDEWELIGQKALEKAFVYLPAENTIENFCNKLISCCNDSK